MRLLCYVVLNFKEYFMKALMRLQEQEAAKNYNPFDWDLSADKTIRLVPLDNPLFEVRYLDEFPHLTKNEMDAITVKWKKNRFKAEFDTPLMGAEQGFEPGVLGNVITASHGTGKSMYVPVKYSFDIKSKYSDVEVKAEIKDYEDDLFGDADDTNSDLF
jgi:hypothetical protein